MRAEKRLKDLNIILPIVLSLSIFTTLISDEILLILIDQSKINRSLINVFQIGIWIEFLRLIINLLKNITISEYKTNKIIMDFSKDKKEFDNFINVYQILKKINISIPVIYEVHWNKKIVVTQDLGDNSFDKLFHKLYFG